MPLRKVTIVPRGMGLGLTWYLKTIPLPNKTQLQAQIASLLGGRVAEEIVFGEITSGASNDLQRVTQLARTMVTQLGMSEELGPRVYGQKQEMVFWGEKFPSSGIIQTPSPRKSTRRYGKLLMTSTVGLPKF